MRKASVYLVGARWALALGAVPRSDSPSDHGGTRRCRPRSSPRSWARLLRNAGVELRDWYDPRFERPEDWPALLLARTASCWSIPNRTWISICWQADCRLLVDARDHHFKSGSRTANERHQPVSAIYTGVVPVVYKAQRTLLNSLVRSTVWAFVMIAVVMVFVVRIPRPDCCRWCRMSFRCS